MNNLILSQSENLTMSSEQIAELLELRHDNVRQAAKNLESHGVIAFTEFSVKGNGRPKQVMQFDKRNSIIITAKLNAQFMMRIVDRWLHLESQQAPALPQNYLEALEHLVTKEKLLIEQAPKVEYFNKVLETTNGFTTTEIATELNMSAIKLNKTLKEMTVQRKIGNRWVLTAANLGNDYTTERTHVDESGKSRHSMMWTEKGRKFILDLLDGKIK